VFTRLHCTSCRHSALGVSRPFARSQRIPLFARGQPAVGTAAFDAVIHFKRSSNPVARNAAYCVKYEERHGRLPDLSKGVDNVTINDVEDHEDRWDKILTVMGRR